MITFHFSLLLPPRGEPLTSVTLTLPVDAAFTLHFFMDAAALANQAAELAALRERATSFGVHLHMPGSLLKSWDDAALLQSA